MVDLGGVEVQPRKIAFRHGVDYGDATASGEARLVVYARIVLGEFSYDKAALVNRIDNFVCDATQIFFLVDGECFPAQFLTSLLDRVLNLRPRLVIRER